MLIDSLCVCHMMGLSGLGIHHVYILIYTVVNKDWGHVSTECRHYFCSWNLCWIQREHCTEYSIDSEHGGDTCQRDTGKRWGLTYANCLAENEIRRSVYYYIMIYCCLCGRRCTSYSLFCTCQESNFPTSSIILLYFKNQRCKCLVLKM